MDPSHRGRVARYLTHPQVLIDPVTEIPKWSLNEVGRSRVTQLARRPNVLAGTTRIISSTETKALETANPLAMALGVPAEIHADMFENDRSSTGYLPAEEFEAVADHFFAVPDISVRGWERAVDAQARIFEAVSECLAEPGEGDVLFIGHGGVGTLLYCALAGVPIDRKHDQGPGGGGNWFQFDMGCRMPLHSWRPMEDLFSP